MPTRPPMRCSWYDCDEIATIKGRCATHVRKRPSGQHRDLAEDQRNTPRWRTEAHTYLQAHSRCNICGHTATVVDHIVEIADNGAMWDHGNWQPLCAPCHEKKTKAAARKRLARKAQARRKREPSAVEMLWEALNK